MILQHNRFFHGSTVFLPIGTILRGRGDAYKAEWGHNSFYQILERYRPPNQIPHLEAVFMCDNDNDLDCAGGGTDWVFTLETLTSQVSKHDMNWSSAISAGQSCDAPERLLAEYARNYWAGTPHPSDESLWEYLTPAARIIAVEQF